MQQAADVFGESDLGVISGFVADNLPDVCDTPELSGVVRDAVEDVERYAVFVFYVRRLYGLAEELLHVPFADIACEFADVAFGRLVLEEASVDLARHDYPDLDYPQLPSQAAAGVEEAERLVGRLGPAVEDIWPRVVIGADAVSQPCVVRPLVPLRGLVGAGRDHPPNALLQREPVDALHHVHVAPLTSVERLGIVAFRLEVPTMDYHVHVREQGLRRRVFVREQVEGFDPFDAVARGVRLSDIDE